jgi:nucleoside-diphosphate-sugar epimerase
VPGYISLKKHIDGKSNRLRYSGKSAMTNEGKKSRKALVTGASGYIGGALVSRLLAVGWSVAVVGRSSERFTDYSRNNPKLESYVLDSDFLNLEKIVRESNPTMVFHVASKIQLDASAASITSLIAANITLGCHLLAAMAKNGTQYFLNVGSYWEHYNNEEFNPVDLYAASKRSFVSMLAYFVEAFGISATTLELYDVYGPNDDRGKIIDTLLVAAKNDLKVEMSPGNQIMNFVYISDVIEGFMIAANGMLENPRFELGRYALRGETSCSLRGVEEVIEKVAGKNVFIEWGALDYRDRTVMSPPDKVRILESWKPKIGLEVGMRTIYRSL